MTPLWRRLLRVRLGLAVVLQLCPREALADARRVVLIDPGVELERAARAALEPWQLELLVVSAPTPGATAPTAQERAREIARGQDAIAVVWTSASAGGHALWMYARAGEHVVARQLSTAPPFDAVSAAAVALSIKTLLRHSETAPATERYGALAPDGSAALRGSEQALPGSLRPQIAADARAESTRGAELSPGMQAARSRAESVPAASSSSQAPRPAFLLRPPSNVQLDLGAGTRFVFTSARGQELRLGLGATWWPRASRFGISLRGTLGPAQNLDEPLFRGTLRDYSAKILGIWRRDLVDRVRLSAATGLCADVTQLDGKTLPDARAISRTFRVVPSLALELGADWRLSRWTRVGLRAAASSLLRTQRYLVRAQPVLELSRRSYEASFVVGLSLPSRP